MKKRVFSALLALCLAFSLFGTALAATAETPSETASMSSSESTTVQENGTEGTDSGDSSVSSTGETGNTGTDSSSEENADSNSTELTGTDTTGNDSQTDIDSQSDDAAATAADGAADDAATADATNGTDSYVWGGHGGGGHGDGGGSTSGNYSHIDVKTTAALTGTSDTRTVRSIKSLTYRDAFGQDRSVRLSSRPNSGEWTSDHGLQVPTDTTINITFTLSDGNSYTSTITSSTTYPSGTYYPTTGDEYEQLTEFLGNSVEYVRGENGDVLGVDISGLSVFKVSSVVCNGANVSGGSVRVDGLDLVLNVATLLGTAPNFDFVVEKTLKGSNTLEEGQFTFTFQEANVSKNTWTVSTAGDAENQMLGTSAATNSEEGATSITQTIDGDPVAYPTSSSEGTVYHYYILREIAEDETSVTYDDTIYGIVVAVKTKQTSLAGSSTTVYSTTVDSVQVYQLNASENDDYTQGGKIETTKNADGDYVFPFTNTYDPGPETTTLTLQKTFVGLSAAEVNYLIFGQSSGFGWDINYCQTTMHSVDGNDSKQTFMAVIDESDYITLSDGTEINAGGDFSITAEQFLCCGDNGITSFDGDEYTNHKTGASLTQDSAGNWVFSITIDVYKTDDTHFYTVFEQHQEVPGYAKINDSNATWTISGSTDKTGYGKFIDTAGGNIYENMPTEVNGGETTVAGTTYNELEDVAIALGYFEKLRITGATTISFTNNYTGDLEVTKKYGDESAYTDANKTFTITVAPADPEKLALGTGTHGLSDKTFSYTIKNEDGTVATPTNPKVTLDSNGSFTIELKAGQTVHFTDMPAIQWVVTENVSASSQEGYTLTSDITDTNNGVVDEVTHWNGYSADVDNEGKPVDVIGGTYATDTALTSDGVASVDSAVRDIDDPAVNASAVALVTITNTYTRIKNTLTISKHVSGPMGDTSADFSFTLTLKLGEEAYELSDDVVSALSAYNFSTGDTVDDGIYTFTLRHNQSLTLTLPYGVTAQVVESDSGYTVYTRTNLKDTGTGAFDPEDNLLGYESDADRTVELTMPSAADTAQTIDFMNYRAAAVPTGVDTDSAAPYLVLTACAAFAGLALAGSIVAVRLRRRRQE